MTQNYFKKLYCVLTCLVFALPAMAYDFESGKIFYNITSSTDKTVEVTYQYEQYSAYDTTACYSGDVKIPTKVTYKGVTYDVTAIGDRAFEYCLKLNSVDIPSSVTNIGSKAFAFSSNIEKIINRNEKPQTIGKDVFDAENISKFTLIVKTGYKAAYEKANVWKDFGSIKEYVTRDTEYTYFYVNGIYYKATTNENNEKTVEVTNSDEYYRYYDEIVVLSGAPSYSEAVVIPSGVIYKGSLYKVVGIGNKAFHKCPELTSVDIPSSVEYIRDKAFDGCTGLTDVIDRRETPQSVADDAFDGVNMQKCKLHVPIGSRDAYRGADVWERFTEFVEFNPTGTEVVKAGNVTVTAISGEIIIMGADNAAKVTVYSIGGALIYAGGSKRIAATPGFYIVRVGDIAKKVVVK